MNQSTDGYQEASGGGLSRRLQPLRLGLRWHVRGLLRKPRSILVELRSRLSGEVMALPLYGALKRTWPDCRVAVRCNFPDLLVDHPHVDLVNPEDFAFDRFIHLRGGPRNRYPILHYAKQARVAPPKSRPHIFYNDWATPLLQPVLVSQKPMIALCPGSSWPAKRWDIDFWKKLGRMFLDTGYGIVELGVAEDPLIDVGVSLRGLTTVHEAACILHAAKLAITTNSGLMHLALAADTPTIALFGPTDPAIVIHDEPRLTPLTNGRPCQACWNRFRMTEKGICPVGIPECLGTIRPERVFEQAKEVLDAAE